MTIIGWIIPYFITPSPHGGFAHPKFTLLRLYYNSYNGLKLVVSPPHIESILIDLYLPPLILIHVFLPLRKKHENNKPFYPIQSLNTALKKSSIIREPINFWVFPVFGLCCFSFFLCFFFSRCGFKRKQKNKRMFGRVFF